MKATEFFAQEATRQQVVTLCKSKTITDWEVALANLVGHGYHLAVSPDGKLIWRKSDRTYTHVIVCPNGDGYWTIGFSNFPEKELRKSEKRLALNVWPAASIVTAAVEAEGEEDHG